MSEMITAHLLLKDTADFQKVKAEAEALNLKVISRQPNHTVAVAGDRNTIENMISGQVVPTNRVRAIGRAAHVATEYDATEATVVHPQLETEVSRVVFPVRPNYWQVHAFPPRVPYYHLHVPQDITRLLGLERAHINGLTGQGVRVAMIDTGFYRAHPYYNTPLIHGGRALNITTHSVMGQAISNPDADEYGHGTGIASNVLAVAPGCEFHHIKDDGDPLAAFAIARNIGAQVITCSWGWSESYVRNVFTSAPNSNDAIYLRALESAIRDAVHDGVVVLFASGNGPLPGSWPSGMPEVISVGGAMIDADGTLRASGYATSFISQIYANRRCPDVCGLVGPEPYGLLIMMPTQPNNELDGEFSAVDGTQTGDGWLVASGTSSATPQVAGFAALMLQLNSQMTPAQIKATLQDMAVGVNRGTTGSGHAANSQRPNLATGYGLVTLLRPNRDGGYTLL
ncbi:MAG TPA: S8 family serine peptidase [Blastocatellia bacterium]|nr:S8 family serine peptidase [Blastocatellia bacterium]